jgi:hypothetical protein
VTKWVRCALARESKGRCGTIASLYDVLDTLHIARNARPRFCSGPRHQDPPPATGLLGVCLQITVRSQYSSAASEDLISDANGPDQAAPRQAYG